MSVDVVMPQMGESITEGTVSKWLKAVGDRIEKDEPILEISTDKVDAEVPSPGAGVLLAINTPEGETVEVGTVVAVIGEEGEAPAGDTAPPGRGDGEKAAAATTQAAPEPAPVAPETPVSAADRSSDRPSTNSDQAAEVVMPQMGESITEGTVSKWLKKVGDTVAKDEPLLEISTDKVDAEVPSPAAGTLLSISVPEGETVEVGSVLALVGARGGTTAPKKHEDVAAEAGPAAPKVPEAPKTAAVAQPVAKAAAATNGGNGNASIDELRRRKSSPLVRNIAKEHGIDITRIPGSGRYR